EADAEEAGLAVVEEGTVGGDGGDRPLAVLVARGAVEAHHDPAPADGVEGVVRVAAGALVEPRRRVARRQAGKGLGFRLLGLRNHEKERPRLPPVGSALCWRRPRPTGENTTGWVSISYTDAFVTGVTVAAGIVGRAHGASVQSSIQ